MARKDMKLLFIVTSCAMTDSSLAFKGTSVRSFYTGEQRAAQTINTLNNLRSFGSDSDIILVDVSADKVQTFQDYADNNRNFKYVHLADIDPLAAKISRTHPSKSHCEANQLVAIFKNFKKDIRAYDYVIKISARYQIVEDSFNFDYFNDKNKNKFIFKTLKSWSGEQINHIKHLCPYDFIQNDTMTRLATVFYAVGKEKISQWEYLMALCCQYSQENSSMYYLDIE
ncbi:MAG: hypothetical protein ACO3UU_13250, partial [Minisyncoccia bacterium]